MEGKKACIGVVVMVQSIYAGMFLLSKVALDVGMNPSIFAFYRQAAATLFLAPIALFLERNTAPPLSPATFLKIFLISLFGITISFNMYGFALKYTSASLAAATSNSLPVITFVLAVFLRMENVKLKTSGGIAKLGGIVCCVTGVGIIAFYKGPYLNLHFQLFHYQSQHLHHQVNAHSSISWIKGVFLMLLGNICWGFWLVFQGRILKSYPSKLLSTALQCLLSTIQSFVIAIAFDRDPRQWRIGWDVKLLSVIYSGVMVTGVTFYLQSWVIERKGPVFLVMTTPLALLFTIISSALFLGDSISLGSVFGGLFLVLGLYSVLWAKSKEQKDIKNSASTSEQNKGFTYSNPEIKVENTS